jgi:hypothetical protein
MEQKQIRGAAMSILTTILQTGNSMQKWSVKMKLTYGNNKQRLCYTVLLKLMLEAFLCGTAAHADEFRSASMKVKTVQAGCL